MLRNLTLVGMVCLGLSVMSGTSEAASPSGKSFKVEGSEGTKAGIAFSTGFTLRPVQVHTPEGDFNGRFIDFFGLFVTAFAVDNGYVGGFTAVVGDPQPGVPGTMTIQGTLVGSTGIFTFQGTAKN